MDTACPATAGKARPVKRRTCVPVRVGVMETACCTSTTTESDRTPSISVYMRVLPTGATENASVPSGPTTVDRTTTYVVDGRV